MLLPVWLQLLFYGIELFRVLGLTSDAFSRRAFMQRRRNGPFLVRCGDEDLEIFEEQCGEFTQVGSCNDDDLLH